MNVATAPPTMATQVPPAEPDAAHAAPATRPAVQVQSGESGLHPHCEPSDTASRTDSAVIEIRESETSGTILPPAARPGQVPCRPGPNADNMHTEPDDKASGDSPSPGTLASQDREIMPPPPPRPPRVGDHLDLEELRRGYDIYHRMPSPNMTDALRIYFQGVRGNWLFAAALLPHGATSFRGSSP